VVTSAACTGRGATSPAASAAAKVVTKHLAVRFTDVVSRKVLRRLQVRLRSGEFVAVGVVLFMGLFGFGALAAMHAVCRWKKFSTTATQRCQTSFFESM
jgi:hypothetical protein